MGELQADLQIWIYVILGIIYAVSKMLKKPAAPSDFPEYGPENPVPGEGNAGSGRGRSETERTLTFEELLREITEGKAVPTSQREVPEKSYESFEEVVEDDERSLEVERSKYRDDEVVAAYEEAKRQAFVRPSLEETMSLKNTDMKFGRFKEFDHQQRPDLLQVYLSDFKDPEGLKKAIVMSEILQRKF